MTTFLVLLSALVLAELVAGVQIFRHDRPLQPPASHPDWADGTLPSGPYAIAADGHDSPASGRPPSLRT